MTLFLPHAFNSVRTFEKIRGGISQDLKNIRHMTRGDLLQSGVTRQQTSNRKQVLDAVMSLNRQQTLFLHVTDSSAFGKVHTGP